MSMLLESTLLRQDFVRLAPAIEIVNDGVAPASCYDPYYIFVAIVDFLVFGIGGYERKVSRRELLSVGAVRAADYSAMPARSVDDGIWMSIRRECDEMRNCDGWSNMGVQGIPSSPWWWTALEV